MAERFDLARKLEADIMTFANQKIPTSEDTMDIGKEIVELCRD